MCICVPVEFVHVCMCAFACPGRLIKRTLYINIGLLYKRGLTMHGATWYTYVCTIHSLYIHMYTMIFYLHMYHMDGYTYVYIYVYICICTNIYICMYICIYEYIYIHIHIYTHMKIYMCVCVCVRVFVRVYVCVRVYGDC